MGHPGSSKERQVQRELTDDRLTEFERIFYPRSIALVGASKDSRKMGSLWAKALIQSDFGGPIYPVNPGLDELCGVKVWPPSEVRNTCPPPSGVLTL